MTDAVICWQEPCRAPKRHASCFGNFSVDVARSGIYLDGIVDLAIVTFVVHRVVDY